MEKKTTEPLTNGQVLEYPLSASILSKSNYHNRNRWNNNHLVASPRF